MSYHVMSANKKTVSQQIVDLIFDDDEVTSSAGGEETPESLAIQSQVVELRAALTDEDKTVSIQEKQQDEFSLVHTEPPSPENTELTGPKDVSKVAYGASIPLGEKRVLPGAQGSLLSSADVSLKQSENLRLAQHKVNELESEVMRLRRENEQLAAAGETYKRLKEEMMGRVDALNIEKRELKALHQGETQVLRERANSKDKELVELRRKTEELELRIDSNVRRIRKREKDLEHRLEIARVEEAALVRSKDEMILDLKRRIDQLEMEVESYNRKSQGLYRQLQDKQETVRRVVRALRIALAQLEGQDDDGDSIKRVD